MYREFILITGMFRSGTTLLSTLLNAHPQICTAADSYLPILKEFRNQIATELFCDKKIDPDAPLDHYYFYPDKQLLMKKIQKVPLNIPIKNLSIKKLQKDVSDYSREYSSKIIPYLNELNGRTYKELFESGLKIIDKAYGNKDTRFIGFKLVWTDEFIAQFLDSFANLKVLNIIRDPRAVCASRNVHREKYPWLFLTRHWRKLITFSWLNCIRDWKLKKRTLLIKYEELVNQPQSTVQEICNFLDIDFDKKMINPKEFIDGNGKPWYQNSSYYENEKGLRIFNRKSVKNWKKVLNNHQIKFIEYLCHPEMKIFGYDFLLADKQNFPLELVFDPLIIKSDELAQWIKDYSIIKLPDMIKEMGMEYLRYNSLKNTNLTKIQKERFYLSEQFYDELQKKINQ